MNSVQGLNTFIQPGILRRYQADILNRGRIAVTSPFTGKEAHCRNSIATLRGRLAYYFPSDEFFLLVSHTSFENGFPLSEVVLGNDGQRINLRHKGARTTTLPDSELAGLLDTARGTQKSDRPNNPSIMLTLGYDNFAHQFWNELPALHAWLHSAPEETVAKVAIFLSAEPLGPLLEIFPKLSSAKRYKDLPTPGIPLSVRLGGKRVPADVRNFVRDFVATRGDTPRAARLRQTLLRGFPRVWISVRHGSRTPDNQAEFLLAIIRNLMGRYPHAAVVFDGFSFPENFFSDPRTADLRPGFVKRASLDQEFIEGLVDKIRRERATSADAVLCTTSGLSLSEAISVAGACNLYLCHGGTLQHKIAWFHNVPGVVHTVPDDHEYAHSLANSIEGAIIPELLPPRFSIPTSAPKNRQNKARNYNYRIDDVELAAEIVMTMFQRMISTQEPPP